MGDNSWNGYENKLLFECVGDGRFTDVARPMGCDAIEDGRGVAIADFNGDGKLDVVINNNNSSPTLYMNNQRGTGHWLRVDLAGARGVGRDPLGAKVEVVVPHEGRPRALSRWVEAGSGYASQSDLVLHFGLGEASAIESLTVTWTGGESRRFAGAELAGVLDETVQIRRGGALLRRNSADELAATRSDQSSREP